VTAIVMGTAAVPAPPSRVRTGMPAAREVLLIDDDDRLRRMVDLGLAAEGFRVTGAGDGEAGLELLGSRSFDAICVDVMLPGEDGVAICRRIRAGSDVPIIIVSALSANADVVGGLEAGADDYVGKPFAVPVLAARIRALLRRAGAARHGPGVRVGDVEIDPGEGLVRRAGELVALTATELRLLCRLAAEPGRVFSREELLEQVWGYDYFGDTRLVDVHVGRLRRKIENEPGEPRVVVTERGAGYRLGR
jgi:DNA-binding response OmpR family regulator